MPDPPTTSFSDAELDRLLNLEATALQRDVEVERILKAFKLNPYDILDIDHSATNEEIKKKYKQLSLFIHPDKAKHEKAPDAFDRLKKAEADLSDKAKREDLDATIRQARDELLKSLSLPTSTPPSHPTLKALNPSWKAQLREKSRLVLIDEELRRRRAVKLTLANEGREAQQKEQEGVTRKRKAEDDKLWEESRDQRVGSWRTFASNGTKKKKKAKVEILG